METAAITGKSGFISDMDGVIYQGNTLIPGVKEFVAWLEENGKHFLFLTNSSERSPRELSEKLARLGLSIGEGHFYTSAMATAAFLTSQRPGGSVYVIGEPGLTNALYAAGFSMNDISPDYVVIGETSSYSYDKIKHAVLLVRKGARLIGTNPDVTGPTELGIVPATGALIAPVELAAGVKAYFPGKPNPLMMRNALKKLGCRREETIIIGDRMDTDVLAGIEAGIETVLVLTGVTAKDDVRNYPYKPHYVLDSVADIMKISG
ncbi:MAG: TIGR01457 family HAD-type hydrolase [Chitinivibrionales bacterium]|nr:TIGR01457 family HAD-type hydrolase [Chitinivibrionales bacterium]